MTDDELRDAFSAILMAAGQLRDLSYRDMADETRTAHNVIASRLTELKAERETMFAETAILLTHPDESRRALAKDRIYAILFPSNPPSGEVS